MAETFDCPKCGAPINFDPDQHLDQATMTCPYCGDSIVIPKNIRRSSPVQPEREVIYTSIPTDTVVTKGKGLSTRFWWIFGIVIAGVVICTVVLPFAGLLGISLNGSSAKPTSPASFAGKNALSTAQALLATAAQMPTDLAAQIPISTPTPAQSPTPTVDTTGTAQVTNSTLYETQSNWPVVLQEKFVNNQRNWDTGTTNDSFSLSDLSIAGGKYTWQITSKKSMLTYSAPQMTAQTDLLVSADLQMTTTTADPQDEAGILFRYSDKDNTFYFFGVNPVGTYLLTMFDGTNFNDLISNTQTNLLKPNQVNHLAVSMQGDQILLVINNVVVDSYQDSQLTSGYGGLGANLAAAGEDATFIFTNFYVRAPKP
jgi:hypothetical protein